jgi:hypothetical protein
VKEMELTIQEFVKGKGDFEVRLRAGIETNPPKYPHVMFFIQMASDSRERGKQVTETLYLTLAEMVKLSVLMTTASQFWTKTFDKYSEEDQIKINRFCEEMDRIRESITSIFSDEI